MERGLLIATISTSLDATLPKTLSVAEPLATVVPGLSFFLDSPVTCLITAVHGVLRVGEPFAVRVGKYERSPGSTSSLPRSRGKFWLPPHILSCGLQLLLTGLRHQPWPDATVLFASRALYADSMSPLVELSGAVAACKVAPLCQEAFFVSPKLMTVTTETSQERWQAAVDEAWQADPEAAILRVKWRPSRLGGRTWVAPAATGGQVKAACNPAAAALETEADGPRTMEVAASGSVGYAPHEVADVVMSVCQTHAGVQLDRVASPADLAPGKWIRVADDDPSADPSRIRLYLRTAEEGERIQGRLHGRALQIGVDLVTLRTETVAARGQSNNRWGGPSRAPHAASVRMSPLELGWPRPPPQRWTSRPMVD